MAEPPDFEQIALMAVRYLPMDEAVAAVKEQLRLVWNARGAADLEAMETAHGNYDWSELEDALHALDR
jgi:hypothetical protein